MVNLGDELYFGRYEGITVWEDDVLQRRSESVTRRCGMLRLNHAGGPEERR